MRTAELTGALLDYWVARAEGVPAEQLSIRQLIDNRHVCVLEPPTNGFEFGPGVICFSADWAQGGPIIERERIELLHYGTMGWMGNPWEAQLGTDTHYIDQGPYDAIPGPTPLVAAMRAYVASKFGDEVPDAEGGA
jgi:hypothetical protein